MAKRDWVRLSSLGRPAMEAMGQAHYGNFKEFPWSEFLPALVDGKTAVINRATGKLIVDRGNPIEWWVEVFSSTPAGSVVFVEVLLEHQVRETLYVAPGVLYRDVHGNPVYSWTNGAVLKTQDGQTWLRSWNQLRPLTSDEEVM